MPPTPPRHRPGTTPMSALPRSRKHGLNLQGTFHRSADSDQIKAWGVFFLAPAQECGSGIAGNHAMGQWCHTCILLVNAEHRILHLIRLNEGLPSPRSTGCTKGAHFCILHDSCFLLRDDLFVKGCTDT